MNPEIWGPHAWIFLHTITMNYPNKPTETDKLNYKNFFMSLQPCIPCDMCSNHYKDNLVRYPLSEEVLSCRTNLVYWLIKIHNSVNIQNNKPIKSNQKVVQTFYNMYRPKNFFDYIINHIDVCIILIILLIIIVLEKNRILAKVCPSS